MATIKSGDSAVQLRIDPTSMAARVTLYGPDGNPLSVLLAGNVEITNDVGSPIPVSGTVNVGSAVAVSNLPATQPVSGPLTDAQLRAAAVPVSGFPATQNVAGSVAVSNFPASAGLLAATATGAAAAAVTLTLPAPGAGLFQYLTSLEITAYSTAARTGGATPVVVTSTGLPGALAWTLASAAAVGTVERVGLVLAEPLRASTVNTPVTIVCPATTGVIWRASATYYAAA